MKSIQMTQSKTVDDCVETFQEKENILCKTEFTFCVANCKKENKL